MEVNQIVACDFDGTIAKQDVCDLILEEFGPEDWREIGLQHDRGELTHLEMNRLFVQGLRMTPAELGELVCSRVRIREGFDEFLEECQRWKVQPLIISGGWDAYIRIALQHLSLSFPSSTEELLASSDGSVPVVCNHIEPHSEKGLWRFESSWKGIQHSTPDKQKLLRQLRRSGAKHIIAIGDGSTDIGMAEAADMVFARSSLAHYCKERGIKAKDFESFKDIHEELLSVRRATVAVLSLPSYHPYTKRINDGWHVSFVNPDEDSFAEPSLTSPENIDTNYPPDSYELVHIHFEYDLIPPGQLQRLLDYFAEKKKPIVWTCHDRKSLREDSGKDASEKSLYETAGQVLTLTEGCKRWLELNLGKPPKDIAVIPHGYIAHPDVVTEESETVKKERNVFTLHVGDFRKSKEFIESIRVFLSCPGLEEAILQVIYRPVCLYPHDKSMEKLIQEFSELIKHPRVRVIEVDPIPDELLTRAFLSSHAVILPYKWGTHSGQLELAKDTGCHVVATNVGFYEEQGGATLICEDLEDSYRGALLTAYQQEPLAPMGTYRKSEWEAIILKHQRLYKSLSTKDGGR